MRNWAIRSAIALSLALSGCGGEDNVAADRARSEAIDRLAQSVVAQRGVPGIAIAVLRNGELFHSVTFGSADLASRQPVSSATPFQLASTTKLFSSLSVLLLVADGRVRLDDPIGTYLEDLPPPWRTVTVRELLSHMSGLPDITTGTGEIDLVAGDWDSALPIVASQPLRFRPGMNWAYTQTNYAILLRLIERVSGLRFEDFLEQRLFRPLGMRNTFFPDSRRGCAVNYERAPGGRIAIRSGLTFPHYVHAAGGLCASLDDLIIWSQALEAGRVIPRALVDMARTPARLANGANAQVAGPISYGLGWAIDTTPGHRWAGHSGGNSTAFRQYLDDGMTIIVLHNGASDPDAIIGAAARSMLRRSGGAQDELWDAATDGNLAAAEAALQGGADINALDTRSSRSGRYALNWAVLNDHADLVRFLLGRGAAVNAQNRTGFTALHHAAEAGSANAARALLAAGADTSIRNAAGATPADVARSNGNLTVARLIDAASAGRRSGG